MFIYGFQDETKPLNLTNQRSAAFATLSNYRALCNSVFLVKYISNWASGLL